MKFRLFYIFTIISLLIKAPAFSLDSKVIFNQGLEAFRASNYSSAELLFRKTLEKDDDYRDRAWFYLARTIYQQGKYKAAIFEFNSFLTKCRTESLRLESRFWMAEAYFFQNDPLKAIEEYNRFLDKSQDITLSMTARDRIATIYYNQNRFEEAIIEWEESIKNSTDMDQNAQIVIKIGRAFFKNGDYEKSLERLLPLLSARINSRNKSEIRLLVGRIYQLQNDHRKAIAAFNAIPKELTESYPFYDVYYFRALSSINMDRPAAAKSELDVFSLIGKKSEFYNEGMFELGRILLEGGKPESGIEILHNLWENNDDTLVALKSGILISEYYMESDPVKSIQYIEKFKITADDDLNKKILLMLTRAHVKAERFDKAEISINTFIEKYPYDQEIDEINFLKGIVLLQRGELDRSLEIFDRIKKENPFSKFINDTDYYMALVSFKKDKYEEATVLLNQYVARKGVNKIFDARMLLAEIYIITGDLRRAEREVNILVNTFAKYSNVDRILYQFARAGYEKSLRTTQNYFSILQTKYPDSVYASMVNLLYGDTNFSNANYDKAITFYERYLNSNVNERKGDAYYNLILSNYALKRYSRVIEIINSIPIPPLNENQWKEIPLLRARSFYQMKNFEQVYVLFRWEDISGFSDEDVRMIINSTIQTGDIQTVSAMIARLSLKENLQKEMQLMLAEYYSGQRNYDEAKNIYNSILVSGAEELIKEKTRILLAEIYAETGSYELSLNHLNQVENKEFVAERDCLIIINQFYSGKEKRGAEITGSRLNFILNTRFTEKVLLLNMVYYYNQKDISSFNRYVKLLAPYKQNIDYVDFLSGKLYYETGAFRQSYLSFYKLSLKESDYDTETSYYLGRLNLLFNNNRNGSIKYFQKVLNEENKKNEYVQKSRIELAIIYNEMRNYKASIDLLNDLIFENEKGRFRIQAENLLVIFTTR